ncbi:MAG: DUF5777 family beta-barrel protein [Ferruginibacter sp.]
MRKIFFFFYMLISLGAIAQVDSASKLMNELDSKPTISKVKEPAKVFLSQRLINANTTEMLQKGHLEFKVVHNFGDIGGTFGGSSTGYGLDNSTDIKIGFQLGVTKNLNVIVSRSKGFGQVTQLWEMGFKYRFMQQMENDPSHPLSIALFANGVASSVKHDTTRNSLRENAFPTTSSRQSQVVQLMVARKFGKILSFQLNPTYVHTNYVVPGDVKSIFAFGAAIRVPIYKKFVFIADYFHPFRSQTNVDALKAKGVKLYDVKGFGLELVTPGHVFHLNFTNTHTILENRFLTRTTTSWNHGEYRWGFTVSRNFVVFRDKKKK